MIHSRLKTEVPSQLVEALERYLEVLESGAAPTTSEFLQEYPDIADDLGLLISNLEFIHASSEMAKRDRLTDDSHHLRIGANDGENRLGDFRLVREIGRGGMGVVYEAEQISLKRRVALKVLPFAGLLDENRLQRFKNEAIAAASIHHPHIVNAFFVGQERGVHYYAMRLIEGQSLADLLEDLRNADAEANSPPTGDRQANVSTVAVALDSTLVTRFSKDYFRSIASLVKQAAWALHHAHSMGVVHRDIKPSNLLIDPNGHLWITDFGLAATQSDMNVTLTGELLGTLRYMSPEQAEGHEIVDHRTDVYSLGLVLYELATLNRAYSEANHAALLKQVLETQPPAPRKVRRDIPVVLETIILNATAKDASHRYRTAEELAKDLERYLANQPIVKCRPSRHLMLTTWIDKNRLLAIGIALSGVLLAAAAVGGTMLAVSYRRMAHRETAALAESMRTRRHVKGIFHEVWSEWAYAVVGYPGLEEVNETLWSELIRRNEAMLREHPDDDEVRLEVGSMYRILALVRSQTKQRAECIEAIHKSRDMLQALVDDERRMPESLRELAETYYGLAYLENDHSSKLVSAGGREIFRVNLYGWIRRRNPVTGLLSIARCSEGNWQKTANTSPLNSSCKRRFAKARNCFNLAHQAGSDGTWPRPGASWPTGYRVSNAMPRPSSIIGMPWRPSRSRAGSIDCQV